jgi:hypothetical protein
MKSFSKIKNIFVGITAAEFFKGSISAVILGTIASSPWVLLRAYTGFFVGYLGYLIGYAALTGFKLGAKKEHKSALVVIVPFIILIIPVAELIGLYITALREGVFLMPLEILSLLRYSPELGKQILTNCLIGYIIAFLGTYSLFRKLRRNSP